MAPATERPASPLRVLFAGRNPSGSWQIRGEAIASTRSNWDCTREPWSADLASYDLFCMVKHPSEWLIEQARRLDKPVVYDTVDCWLQPEDGLRCTSLEKARTLFASRWKHLGVAHFIFANRTMKSHLGDLVPRSTFIHHHWRLDRPVVTPKPRATAVVYDGDPAALGSWRQPLERVCGELGLSFLVNPADWTQADIGVAVRGSENDGFLSNNYKCNIKLANLYGMGLPAVVGHKEMSYHETDHGDVRFFRDQRELRSHLSDLLDYETRLRAHRRYMQVRGLYSLDSIASLFEAFFLTTLAAHRARKG